MLSAVVGTWLMPLMPFATECLRNLSDSVATLPWASVSEFPLVRNASNL